jgi:septal ring factor EnvC (AmiA/AmiB activator)
MNDPSAIEQATRRLKEALEALESVVDRRLEHDHDAAALTAQVHAFETDRARLAAELDTAAARAHDLENTNREVAERLDEAMDGIRAVLDVHDQTRPDDS